MCIQEVVICKIGNTFKSINVLTAKNCYSEIVQKVKVKATSVKYFEKILAPQEEINWEQVYYDTKTINY